MKTSTTVDQVKIRLWRAMNLLEFSHTMHSRRADFIRRFKWFTDDLSFLHNRILDGRFNNSRYKKEKYSQAIEFEITGEALRYFRRCGTHELILDRRHAHLVTWRRVSKHHLPELPIPRSQTTAAKCVTLKHRAQQ